MEEMISGEEGRKKKGEFLIFLFSSFSSFSLSLSVFPSKTKHVLDRDNTTHECNEIQSGVEIGADLDEKKKKKKTFFSFLKA